MHRNSHVQNSTCRAACQLPFKDHVVTCKSTVAGAYSQVTMRPSASSCVSRDGLTHSHRTRGARRVHRVRFMHMARSMPATATPSACNARCSERLELQPSDGFLMSQLWPASAAPPRRFRPRSQVQLVRPRAPRLLPELYVLSCDRIGLQQSAVRTRRLEGCLAAGGCAHNLPHKRRIYRAIDADVRDVDAFGPALRTGSVRARACHASPKRRRRNDCFRAPRPWRPRR